ncbi:hypothetical protein [Dyadobacter sp. LHD-138]|uniref:hypothetical protein n=1 Tax=Dyadobacter sp. LHD-138 TaxID=3071413 RepID=UPI0038D49DCD
MLENLVREPLEKALLKRRIKSGLIIHSDRGGQYLSNNMKKLVHTFTLEQSMSRADDPMTQRLGRISLEPIKGGIRHAQRWL